MGNKDIIKKHLDGMAEKDKAFAERYANGAKNLDACMDYIMQRARKEATNGMAMIEDNIVYGWAAHYYQEASEDLTNENEKKVKDVKPKDNKVACTVSISKLVKKQEKSKYIELDLFGGTL